MSRDRLILRSLSATEWPAVAAGFADLTFEQTLPYTVAAAARVGARPRFLAVEQNGHPVAAVALRVKAVPGLGRGIAWAPAAPLVRPGGSAELSLTEVFAALRGEIVDGDGHLLRFRLSSAARPEAETVRAAAAAAGFHSTTRAPSYCSSLIDLTVRDEVLMRQLNGKWRTDLRYSLKSGLGLDHGDGPGLRTRFLRLFEEVQGAKGFAPEIRPEFHFALAGQDYPLEILIARKDGTDLAGIVVGWAGETAVYLFGATAEAGRRFRAGYLLTWEGIARARARGLIHYDLGGIDATANPDVARFKERMNGTPIFAEAFEASPRGVVGTLVPLLEGLRARLKRRGSGR